MYEACCEHRNTTAAAISSGSAGRPSGFCERTRVWKSSGSLVSMSVRTNPGATVLIVMPSAATSFATVRENAEIAPFAAAYDESPGRPPPV
jgi:hypothetical protein